jgi:guanyl-specific ribonuclease Sa
VSVWADRGARFLSASLLVLFVAVTLAGGVLAETRHGPDHPLPEIQFDALPGGAVDTLVLFRQGGRFPYTRDGLVKGLRDFPQVDKGA